MYLVAFALACYTWVCSGRRVHLRRHGDDVSPRLSLLPAIRQSLTGIHERGMEMISGRRVNSIGNLSFPPTMGQRLRNHRWRSSESTRHSLPQDEEHSESQKALVDEMAPSRQLVVPPILSFRRRQLERDEIGRKCERIRSRLVERVPQSLLDARRNLQFFYRATSLFTAYEIFKFKNRLLSKVRGDSPEVIDAAWAQQHLWGGRQLYQIAVDLQGFHLKGAQWLSARPDICPMEWVIHLSQLQDQCPPLKRDEVEGVVRSELGASIEDVFSEWDDKPIGSASIAQVHRAVLRKRRYWRPWIRKRVAVKIQRPGAEHMMLCDLRSLKTFFSIPYVRKSLAWDPKIVLDQVYNETRAEFDFLQEAEAMDAASNTLRKPSNTRPWRWINRFRFYTPPVDVPRSVPGLVTKRLLVMDMLSGVALSSIERKARDLPSTDMPTNRAKHALAEKLLTSLSEAYGRMLFEDGFGGIHADPHPGNILLQRKCGRLQIGLLDWGQIKCYDLSMRIRLAKVVEALCAAGDGEGRASSYDLLIAFRELGVRWNSTVAWDQQRAAVAATATEWFDTAPLPAQFSIDPTSPNYPILSLGELDMTAFPTDLLYLFRTTQYLRAMGDKLGMEWSLAQHWRPHARRLLHQHGHI